MCHCLVIDFRVPMHLLSLDEWFKGHFVEPPGRMMRFKQAINILQRSAATVRYEEPSADNRDEGDGSVNEANLGLQIRIVGVEQVWQGKGNHEAVNCVSGCLP